jgi:hypothetical protein
VAVQHKAHSYTLWLLDEKLHLSEHGLAAVRAHGLPSERKSFVDMSWTRGAMLSHSGKRYSACPLHRFVDVQQCFFCRC